jgi:hypothetical protein
MRSSEDNTNQHHDNRRWVFRKDISVGNMISMAGLIVGLFAWGNAIERRLVVLEERQIVNSAANDRQDLAVKELKMEQSARLDRIEDKLDAALAVLRANGQQVPFVPRK